MTTAGELRPQPQLFSSKLWLLILRGGGCPKRKWIFRGPHKEQEVTPGQAQEGRGAGRAGCSTLCRRGWGCPYPAPGAPCRTLGPGLPGGLEGKGLHAGEGELWDGGLEPM